MAKAKQMNAKQTDGLLKTLKARFEANRHRHAGLEWPAVQARLAPNAAKLWSLNEMEESGGEPDVVGFDKATGEYIFVDCSAQSPKGRRSVCYERQAVGASKENKSKSNAVEMAQAIGAAILTVDQIENFRSAANSTLRRPAGCRRRATSGSWAARSSAT